MAQCSSARASASLSSAGWCPMARMEVTADFLMSGAEATPDASVIDEAFFRKYKSMSEPDKKKLRKILDAWEDE